VLRSALLRPVLSAAGVVGEVLVLAVVSGWVVVVVVGRSVFFSHAPTAPQAKARRIEMEVPCFMVDPFCRICAAVKGERDQ